MTDYAFVTTWRIEAPIQQVWDAIYHAERWPTWWKGVESVVELEPGDERGIGALRVDPPVALEGKASGELEGMGRWRLSPEDSWTTVRYEWNVRTTKRWMNWLAPLARPLFEWNHNIVMRQGGEGLARMLGARLTSTAER